MPSFMETLSTRAPYHVLAYGTLLGTEFFQTFIGGLLAFRNLPRPHFSQLQSAIFPVYFRLQTLLPPLLLLTAPLPGRPPVSSLLSPSSPHFISTTLPLATAFTMSLMNLAVVGPAAVRVKNERKAQEVREGVKWYDKGEKTQEMLRLNKRFSVLHGVSSSLNFVAFFATVVYGVTLAERLV